MIEIIVSLGVFAVVLVALLPQLIVGIKATGTARVVSQAKGVGQGQIERLRHLPFHITPAAGDYIDVLDRYFPDLGTGTAATCTDADAAAFASAVDVAVMVAAVIPFAMSDLFNLTLTIGL